MRFSIRNLRLILIWMLPLLASTSLAQNGQITLEDIWVRYKYYAQQPNEFRWMQDDRYFSVLEPGKAILRKSIQNGSETSTILDLSKVNTGDKVRVSEISTYEFGPQEKNILLKAGVTPIYRRSTRENCFLVDLNSNRTTPIHNGEKVSNATFSPDGSKLGYVFDNNLFYYDIRDRQTVQVTYDGKSNEIINGATDWVYEEELAFARAFEWSNDGRYMAYLRFDEGHVHEFQMDIYGSLYPQPYTFKYPKAGESNSIVSAHIYDVETRATLQADTGEEFDLYLARLTWTGKPGELAIMRLNRLQNQLDLLLVDARTGDSQILITEKSDTYIPEPTDHKWYFLKGSDDFLWLSEQEGFAHVYRYNREGEIVADLTDGDYEVTEILGADEPNQTLFYISTEESPLERHVYSVRLDGKKKKRLTREAGVYEAEPSSGMNYFVVSGSNLEESPTTVLMDRTGKTIRVLEENKAFAERVAELDIALPELISVPVGGDVNLNGFMIKPADFDKEKQYPLLMYVYGGPGSQEVLNQFGSGQSFNYFWFQMLAQKGYVVACVDNRGTGGRGRDFRVATYADLGNLELQDQVAAAKYFGDLDYIDQNRIGMFGWSYGGYMTLLALTKGKGLFKAGISVAPVTNWRFYDTIYTERYLKRPQENKDGYDQNSPLNFAGDLQGELLLVHGMADDNVHFQNSVEMVNALVNANKQFDSFFYPNRNHGIYGGLTRYHLFSKMTDFILENL